MEPAGAYGAGKAGSVAFDPVAFFTHPRTILRLLSWVRHPLQCVGYHQWTGLPAPPLSVSLPFIFFYVSLPPSLLYSRLELIEIKYLAADVSAVLLFQDRI